MRVLNIGSLNLDYVYNVDHIILPGETEATGGLNLYLGGKGISCRRDVAKVSIVGAGMMSNPGVAAKMFEALYNNNININMFTTISFYKY